MVAATNQRIRRARSGTTGRGKAELQSGQSRTASDPAADDLLPAAALRIDDEHQGQQIAQRMPDPRVGQLVPGPPAFRHCHDQPATAQARQMVGHDLAGYAGRGRPGRPG